MRPISIILKTSINVFSLRKNWGQVARQFDILTITLPACLISVLLGSSSTYFYIKRRMPQKFSSIISESNQTADTGVISQTISPDIRLNGIEWCFADSLDTAIIMKTENIGDTKLIATRNFDNSQVVLDQIGFEDKIRKGELKIVDCLPFDFNQRDRSLKLKKEKQLADQVLEPESWELFGYVLRKAYPEFRTLYEKNVISCEETKYLSRFGTKHFKLDWERDPNYVLIMDCRFIEDVEVLFFLPDKTDPYTPFILIKSVKNSNLLEPILIEKLNSKFIFDFKKAYKDSYYFAHGLLSFGYNESLNTSDDQLKTILEIEWNSKVDIGMLIKKRVQEENSNEAKVRLEQSKIENNNFKL